MNGNIQSSQVSVGILIVYHNHGFVIWVRLVRISQVLDDSEFTTKDCKGVVKVAPDKSICYYLYINDIQYHLLILTR